MDERAREENLLGSFSLAVVDRMLAASTEHAGGGGEAAAGLVSAATYLQGASVEELSRALGLTHSATVRLVDRLEESGDLARRPGGDRRSLSVVATRRGAERAERIRSARVGGPRGDARKAHPRRAPPPRVTAREAPRRPRGLRGGPGERLPALRRRARAATTRAAAP